MSTTKAHKANFVIRVIFAVVIGGLLSAALISVTDVKPSFGQTNTKSCPTNDQGCFANEYANAQVNNFRNNRIGNSHGLQFPQKFKDKFHKAVQDWQRHHKGVPNPFEPIKTFIEDEAGQAACGLSAAVVGGGNNCDNTGGNQWPSVAKFKDNMTYVADVTIGCGGGALIASFNRPANWRVLVTRKGYSFNPWVFGTGAAACTFTTVWFTTHGH